MTFDDAVAQLRAWTDEQVVVVLEPDGSVMRGPLQEIDAAGIDGALFSVSPTGVAVALFRDAFVSADLRLDRELRVRQGRVEISVRRQTGTEAPPPAR
jgi:hypothetical protein